jgi:hypothetical protein
MYHRWAIAKLYTERPPPGELAAALEGALLRCLSSTTAAEQPTAQAVSSVWWATLPLISCVLRTFSVGFVALNQQARLMTHGLYSTRVDVAYYTNT